MSERAWFKPKKFGYGYTPAGWEGWLAVMVYALVLAGGIALIVHLIAPAQDIWEILLTIAWTAVTTIAFMAVAAPRTEGEIRWRWGRG